MFKEQESKTLVINNFVDVDRIIEKSKEKIELEKPKKKCLLVYVGNLDEESKKISRIINIANEIEKVNVWIIGSGKDQAKYEKLIEKNKLESKVNADGKMNLFTHQLGLLLLRLDILDQIELKNNNGGIL